MLKTARVERPIAKAIASLFLWGGLAAPAWATYGGGCLP